MSAAETRRENKARAARMEAARAETRAVVEANRCPSCGSGVHSNLSIAGRVQCDAFGEPVMRRAEHRNLPKCSWQGFTE